MCNSWMKVENGVRPSHQQHLELSLLVTAWYNTITQVFIYLSPPACVIVGLGLLTATAGLQSDTR